MLITKSALEQIYLHARDEYPHECCGIVTSDGKVQTVHACHNIQNRLHEEDPRTYPRDARTAYMIDREEADRICSAADKKGETITAFYHSHVDCEAYFSQTDKDAQTVFGEPEFPEALQLVVSVLDGKVSGTKGYRWDRASGDFLEINIA